MNVWAQVDQMVAKFENTLEGLRTEGSIQKCGVRPSTMNAVHFVAKCRRRDCGDRELIGSAAELPKLMQDHSAAHEARNAEKKKAAAKLAGGQ